MSYTPINWQTGDTITAEKMNKMDNGWSVEGGSVTLCNETVTTVIDEDYPEDPAYGIFDYNTRIDAAIAVVTFDGTPYTCQVIEDGYSNVYGGYVDGDFDFSEVPFAVMSDPDDNYLYTSPETAGAHSVKIEVINKTVETSDSFVEACNNAINTDTLPFLCKSGITTFTDAYSASQNGKMLYFQPSVNTTCVITQVYLSEILYIPNRPDITVFFDNNQIFTVQENI